MLLAILLSSLPPPPTKTISLAYQKCWGQRALGHPDTCYSYSGDTGWMTIYDWILSRACLGGITIFWEVSIFLKFLALKNFREWEIVNSHYVSTAHDSNNTGWWQWHLSSPWTKCSSLCSSPVLLSGAVLLQLLQCLQCVHIFVLYTRDHFVHSVFNFFWDTFSGVPGCPWTYYIVDNNLELLILLPPTPEDWDYRYVPPCWVYEILEIRPWSSLKLL